MQLVEPHNHRSNAAERAIQTFKNHTIAGLCTCDGDFPSVLWCKLIKQAQDTLNMLRTSRVHPKLSAYHVLDGPHDSNRVPFAPPGTHVKILNPPETRTSWSLRAMDAWYLSPAYDHYRAWIFHIPSTGGSRVLGQAVFYPAHCNTRQKTPRDYAAKFLPHSSKPSVAYAKRIHNSPDAMTRHCNNWPKIFNMRQQKHRRKSLQHTRTPPIRRQPLT